jgi:hypothetical protein
LRGCWRAATGAEARRRWRLLVSYNARFVNLYFDTGAIY